MRALAAGLWVIEYARPLFGLEFGTRTSVVRLGDGGLWLHSPGPFDAEDRRVLDALGPVRCIVAPNRLHHLYLPSAAASWPRARLHLAPGVAEKRPEIPPGEVLGDEPPAAWRGQLEQHRVRGVPLLEEVVFFHPATRTLFLTDLCFNLPPARGSWAVFLQRLNAMRGFGPSRITRHLAVRDRAALRDSVERIARWDFARIVLAHGAVVESDAAVLWGEAWAWLD